MSIVQITPLCWLGTAHEPKESFAIVFCTVEQDSCRSRAHPSGDRGGGRGAWPNHVLLQGRIFARVARDLHRSKGMPDLAFWKRRYRLGRFSLVETLEIDADVGRVFTHWQRFEDLPRFMEHVRRTKCIAPERVLWDIDISGHQVVWEAHIVACVPEKLIRWESSWGAPNWGEVRFEALPGSRTRLTVAIEYQPRGILEYIGARLGLADLHVRRDMGRFRRHVESLA